jgi:hypothetical protein
LRRSTHLFSQPPHQVPLLQEPLLTTYHRVRPRYM